MIILAKGYGNHTNRLLQNAHLEAFCKEEDIPYTNLSLFSMARHYPALYNYAEVLRFYALWKAGRYPYVEFTHEYRLEEYKELLRSHRNTPLFVGGWFFRDYTTLANQRAYLRQRYETHKTSHRFQFLVEELKKYDVVLGVHIRRGDYKQWQGGKYFFSNEAYEDLIHHFASLQTTKSLFVLIFSNEKLTSKDIRISIAHEFSHLPYYLDHKLMGYCHYLIGPPSTFTLWPSFLYQVPCLHIEQPQQLFSLADFHCAKG